MFNGLLRRRKRRKAQADKSSIGRLLIDCGYVTQEEILSAIAYQEANEELLLGELLINRGAITREILEVILTRQKAMRSSRDATCPTPRPEPAAGPMGSRVLAG